MNQLGLPHKFVTRKTRSKEISFPLSILPISVRKKRLKVCEEWIKTINGNVTYQSVTNYCLKLCQKHQITPKYRSGVKRYFGLAWLEASEITISNDLIEWCVEHRKHLVYEIIKHEIAHILAYREFGDKDHGIGWATWCIRLGIKPKITYAIDDSYWEHIRKNKEKRKKK
jgi:hypothetical protein